MLCLLLAASAYAADASPSPTWHQLRSPEATATSFLKSNWNKYTENYHPSYALDDDPKTAWVEGVDGQGEGQALTIPVSPLKSARSVKLTVFDGYQKSANLFAANSAPKDVRVRLLDVGGGEVAAFDASLKRQMGPQDLVLQVPGGKGFAAVEIAIVSVWPGSTYQDTCVSDVDVFVDSDVPYAADVEKRKYEALKAWIAERVNTAKTFAAMPPELPWKSGQYQRTSSMDVDEASFQAAVAPYEQAAREIAKIPAYRADATRAAPPLPDGLDDFDSVEKFAVPSTLAFFQAKQAERTDIVKTDEEMGSTEESEVSNPRIEMVDGKPRRLEVSWSHTDSNDRASETTAEDWVVLYDEKGRMTGAYVDGKDEEDDWGISQYRRLWTFHLDNAGKIDGWDEWQGTYSRNYQISPEGDPGWRWTRVHFEAR